VRLIAKGLDDPTAHRLAAVAFCSCLCAHAGPMAAAFCSMPAAVAAAVWDHVVAMGPCFRQHIVEIFNVHMAASSAPAEPAWGPTTEHVLTLAGFYARSLSRSLPQSMGPDVAAVFEVASRALSMAISSPPLPISLVRPVLHSWNLVRLAQQCIHEAGELDTVALDPRVARWIGHHLLCCARALYDDQAEEGGLQQQASTTFKHDELRMIRATEVELATVLSTCSTQAADRAMLQLLRAPCEDGDEDEAGRGALGFAMLPGGNAVWSTLGGARDLAHAVVRMLARRSTDVWVLAACLRQLERNGGLVDAALLRPSALGALAKAGLLAELAARLAVGQDSGSNDVHDARGAWHALVLLDRASPGVIQIADVAEL